MQYKYTVELSRKLGFDMITVAVFGEDDSFIGLVETMRVADNADAQAQLVARRIRDNYIKEKERPRYPVINYSAFLP